jgi:hypothetical protein
MNKASSEVRASVCQQLVKGGGKLCGDVADYCSTGATKPAPKCEKPTPGLDPSSRSGCKDLQTPQISLSHGTATLSICGHPVFHYAASELQDSLFADAYKVALRDVVKTQMGSKVCCVDFLKAVRSGVPCDPRADLDCDGKLNDADFDLTVAPESPKGFPHIDLFTKPEGASIDPFPAGLDPDDPNFIPPAQKCDCKWELLKGTLNCSPDGRQPHSYQARWRCPSTGNEVFTRKEAPATTPCE